MILGLLDKLMEGKKNKDAAVIIQAALLAGAILRPSHKQFCNRYGESLIKEKAYYKYVGLDKKVITKKEIEPIKLKFDTLLAKLS